MHAKVKVLKPSPQTFLAGMHAQLRPIGGRSEPDFSLYNDKECESQLLLVHAHGPDRALGLCTNPRSKESKPASKEKVVFLTRGGRPVGEYAHVMPLQGGLALWPCAGVRPAGGHHSRGRARIQRRARPRTRRIRVVRRTGGPGR